MRIAFVSYEFPPETGGGGIGTYLRQTAPALAAAGHDIEVFAGGRVGSSQRESDRLVIHRVACAASPDFARDVLPAFAAAHRARPFDVVEGCDFDASAGRIKHLFPQLPYVCKLHTPRFAVDELHHRLPTWSQRLRMALGALRRARPLPPHSREAIRRSPAAQREVEAMARADILAAPSQAIARAAEEWVPGCTPRVRVFPYPYVPPRALLEIPTATSTARITFVGRIEERKGVLDLAVAIPLVLRDCPQARFRFVGRAMQTPDGSMMMDDAIRLRLGASVSAVEFTGPQPPARLAEFLAATDILVAPSHWESFGLVCCEGLAAGRAVVACSGTGMAEILADGECGVIVEPRNPSALAAALIRLLAAPDERVRLGDTGRRRILNTYSLENVRPQQVTAYEAAIAIYHDRPGSPSP